MKLWKDGVADETWKIIICAENVRTAESALSALTYILADSSSGHEASLNSLRAMSGKEIVDGLLAYRSSAYRSVEKALKKEPTP